MLSFLKGVGRKIGGAIQKIPGLLGRGSQFATQKVVPAVRKIGEVASVLSRGIGEEAPEGLRKIGAIAGQVGQKAGQVAGSIEKGAQIGGEIAKALQPQPVATEASAEAVEGGAMKGFNYMRNMGSAMGGMKPMYR